MDGSTTETSQSENSGMPRWHAALDTHGSAHGFHQQLGDQHGVLYTEDDDTLLVTFENAEDIREAGGPRLPFGLSVAGREGWSHLGLYCEGDTWFRAPEIYALFDTLIDEGFFDDFERVVFYGAGPCGYAAAAFSVSAPGAELVLIRPHASLDPRVSEWDERYPEMRRVSFTDRYGFAPFMADAAAKATIIYDPYERVDAMHAALYTREGFEKIRCPLLGKSIAHDLESMGVLLPMLRAAGRGSLTAQKFAQLYRGRRRFPPYLRRILSHLEESERPYLTALHCRAVLRNIKGPRFRRAYADANKELEKLGISLPPGQDGDE